MTDTPPPSRAQGFALVVDSQTRVLILGSLPGAASLKLGQYYAHPRNGFWPILAGLVGEALTALPYEKRLERLKSKGIGLWDVLASAERAGSLDAAIRSPEAADLCGLVSSLPNLRAVAFNGALAAKTGTRILAPYSQLTLLNLPSTSPAHAAMGLEAKAAAWARLLPLIGEPPAR